MDIQFIRLELDVCGPINQLAQEMRRTVSDVVNEAVREFLNKERLAREAGAAEPID